MLWVQQFSHVKQTEGVFLSSPFLCILPAMKMILPAVKTVVGSLGLVLCLLMLSPQAHSQYADNYLLKENFEKELNGKEISLAVLKNGKGMEVAVTNYGARLVSARLPDKTGKPVDIVVGFNSIDEYINAKGRNYGATVGRYANRIANAQFDLDGKRYNLPQNSNGNNIHGGPGGFNDQVWDWVAISDKAVTLSYLSKDGENGFPGNLKVMLTYSLNKKNELEISYSAQTDRKTVLNLTNHSYFNLDGGGTVAHNEVMVNAGYYTPVNENLIPTGEIRSVINTPFDLRKPTIVSTVWDKPDPQLRYGGGFDHNFVLNKRNRKKPKLAASMYSPESGIQMTVHTTEPGIQFFTANTLKGDDKDRNGNPIAAREAFCLETQHFPNSPNQPNFPSTVLEPGKKFESHTIYRLQVR